MFDHLEQFDVLGVAHVIEGRLGRLSALLLDGHHLQLEVMGPAV